MDSFLVSIIVPCYNASHYVKEVLESIQNQTYKNIECIVINDGSTDDTLDIITAFYDPRFTVYSQENKGLSDTRNAGLEKATGNFIFFCDSDDCLPQNAIESLLSAYTGKEDVIAGKTALVTWNDKKILSYLPHPENKQTIENKHSEVLIKNMIEGLSPIAPNKLYKTDFLRKNNIKFLSGIYHEDELWFFEVMFAAENVAFIPEVTYYYTKDNTQSITQKNGDKNLLGYLSVIQNIYEKYYLKFPERSIIAYYIVYLKKIIIGNYKHHGNYSSEAVQQMETAFREVNPKFNNHIELDNTAKKYFRFLNNVSLKDAQTIKKEYFNYPVNSLRKHYKILIFSLLNPN